VWERRRQRGRGSDVSVAVAAPLRQFVISVAATPAQWLLPHQHSGCYYHTNHCAGVAVAVQLKPWQCCQCSTCGSGGNFDGCRGFTGFVSVAVALLTRYGTAASAAVAVSARQRCHCLSGRAVRVVVAVPLGQWQCDSVTM
jgi:hypothetical protein